MRTSCSSGMNVRGESTRPLFIHQPPPTNPLALQFFGAIVASHFAAFFFLDSDAMYSAMKGLVVGISFGRVGETLIKFSLSTGSIDKVVPA